MYAIIQDGEKQGKQYQVAPGKAIEIERKECAPGSPIEFSQVLFYKDKENTEVGTPFVEKVKVKGVVEEHVKGDKITVFKFKRRKDHRRKQGHRQVYTRVRIQQIVKE